MLKVVLEDAKPGMVLARSLYSAYGDLLLAAGCKLNPDYINRLKVEGFNSFWIQDEDTEEVVSDDMVNEQLNLQTNIALRDSMETVKKIAATKEASRESIEKSLNDTSKFKDIIAVEKIQGLLDDIITELLGNSDILVNLSSIQNIEAHLFQHNLDVAILSIILAKALKFNKFDINELAMGAVMHDIGQIVLPKELASKNTRLSFQEFTLYKEHPTYGYKILKENQRIPPVSNQVAFQHHERQDGAGYPRGLRGANIMPTTRKLNVERGMMHRFSEIVAVADAYTLMISPKFGLKRKSPEEALKSIIIGAGTQFNKEVVKAMISVTPVYPVGSVVQICDGPERIRNYTAVVVKVRKKQLNKPMIIIIKSPDGKRVKPFKIDLLNNPEVKIKFRTEKN